MSIKGSGGLSRTTIASRYDVASFTEDPWHSYADAERSEFVKASLRERAGSYGRLLNAGAGVYSLGLPEWFEIRLDLFRAPLLGDPLAVCGSILQLPFPDFTFDAVVCIGEVLGYCDPAQAIPELARVLAVEGILVFDFASTRSPRFWRSRTFGRAADVVTVTYNGSLEKLWAYDLSYVRSIARQAQLSTLNERFLLGWAAALDRFGVNEKIALKAEALLGWLTSVRLGDLVIVSLRRNGSATRR